MATYYDQYNVAVDVEVHNGTIECFDSATGDKY